MSKSSPLYKQLDVMDCGPTCLRMVAKYYGCTIPIDFLRNKSQYGKEGVSMLGPADAAESIGLKAVGAILLLGIAGISTFGDVGRAVALAVWLWYYC